MTRLEWNLAIFATLGWLVACMLARVVDDMIAEREFERWFAKEKKLWTTRETASAAESSQSLQP
jgi:hypothetical protein